MITRGKRPTLGEMLLQHLIVFLICVAFPGVVTFMAPATWLTFERSEASVRCTTRTCVFFVIPFKVQRVDPVIEIGHRERAGRTERQRKFGSTTNETVNIDGEGFLQICGVGEQRVEVSVSPASLERVVAKSNDFLNSTQERSMTLFAIANWKFGGLMGGTLSLFTLLYVVGYASAAIKSMLTAMPRIFISPSNP